MTKLPRLFVLALILCLSPLASVAQDQPSPTTAANDQPAAGDAAKEQAAGAEGESTPLAGHSFHGEAFNEGPRQRAYLMPGTGKIYFGVTTEHPDVKAFVEQGIGQLHGFWYFEAERSFRQAAMLDPDCAIAYWGMAMANANNNKRAVAFIEEAVERKDKAGRLECMFIDALHDYLTGKGNSKEKAERYVAAFEKMVAEFPDDIEAHAFYAYALYRHRTSVKMEYEDVEKVLQDVLAKEPMHPVHHYRIHLWDFKQPSNVVDSSAVCGQAAPAIAHMWHMPGHIFSRLKRYEDAVWQQEASARVDHAHMMRDRVLPDQIHNFAHNNEWLIRNMNYIGRWRDAVDLAKNMIELPQHPKYNTLSRRGSTNYGRERLFETLYRYEKWDSLIRLANQPYLEPTDRENEQNKRLKHLGVAYAEAGKPDEANKILDELKKRREALLEKVRKEEEEKQKKEAEEKRKKEEEAKRKQAEEEARKAKEAEAKQAEAEAKAKEAAAKNQAADDAAAQPGGNEQPAKPQTPNETSDPADQEAKNPSDGSNPKDTCDDETGTAAKNEQAAPQDAPDKSQPAQSETAQPKAGEESASETAKPEAANTEAAKTDEAKTDDAKTDDAKAASKGQPAEKTPAKNEPAKKQPAKKNPAEEFDKAIALIEAHLAIAAGDFKAAQPLLKRAGEDGAVTARVLSQAGEHEAAVKAIDGYVKSQENRVHAMAAKVEILFAAGKTDEAKDAFESLRNMSGSIQFGSPVFDRLQPIAAELGLPEDWRIDLQPAADVGDRPSLSTLGPFRWRPMPAPEWLLHDSNGKQFSLKHYHGKPLVVIFYLGYGCLHCAEQLQAFAPMAEQFREAGIEIIGISTDEPKDLRNSIEAYEGGMPFPLVSDAPLNVFKDYRAYDDFENVTLHGTFLIDGDGLIRWQDISYEPFMDPEFVLKEAKRLLAQEVPPADPRWTP